MIQLPLLSDIAKSLKTGEIGKVEKQIAKLREIALHLEEENLVLREEIKKLRGEKGNRTGLEFSEGVYWRLESDQRVGPFCPRCYNEHHRLAQLLDGSRFVAKTRWICTVCNRVFD